MQTKEELALLKEEVEKLDSKLRELAEDELKLVIGGGLQYDWRDYGQGNTFLTGDCTFDHNSASQGGNIYNKPQESDDC